MKRFKFSLQTVHNLRVSKRDKAELELAQAAAEVAKAIDQIAEAEQVRVAAEEECAQMLRTPMIDPHEVGLRSEYLYSLATQKSHAQARLATLEQEREAQRELLVQASRAARTTEQLRERHLAHYQFEAARVEQYALDEMAVLAAARRLTKTQ